MAPLKSERPRPATNFRLSRNFIRKPIVSWKFPSQSLLHDSLFTAKGDDFFRKNYKRILKNIEESQQRLPYDDMEELPQSEYNKLHKEESKIWKSAITQEFSYGTGQDFRVVYRESESKICNLIILTFDFFLAYDASKSILVLKVPLSPLIAFDSLWVESLEWKFNHLVGNVPMMQIHLLIRRLIQMTSVSWEYECLANIEKEASLSSNGTRRLRNECDIFGDRKIKMPPASSNEICGCRIGIIDFRTKSDKEEVEDSKSCLGIEFDGIIYYVREKFNGISSLSREDSMLIKFEEDAKMTDYIDILIGGYHTKNSREEITVKPWSQEDEFDYNLAFIPQNHTFCNKIDVTFTNPDDINNVCKKLGYGKLLSHALGLRAGELFVEKGIKEFTLREVQTSLFLKWSSIEGQAILRMRKGPIKKGEYYVKLDGNNFLLEKAQNSLEKKFTVGLNFGPLSFGMVLERTNDTANCSRPLFSFFEAAKKISGHEELNLTTDVGSDWKWSRRKEIRTLLGSTVLLCCIMQGNVNPEGEFRYCVPSDRIKPSGIRMNFDIPIPYGVTCATLARRKPPSGEPKVLEPERHKKFYSFDGDCMWDLNTNYKYPAIISGNPKHHPAVYYNLNMEYDAVSINNEATEDENKISTYRHWLKFKFEPIKYRILKTNSCFS